jgi:hypothetical protein
MRTTGRVARQEVFPAKIFWKIHKQIMGKAEKNPPENYSFQTFVQSFADDYFSAIIGRSPSVPNIQAYHIHFQKFRQII